MLIFRSLLLLDDFFIRTGDFGMLDEVCSDSTGVYSIRWFVQCSETVVGWFVQLQEFAQLPVQSAGEEWEGWATSSLLLAS